MHLTTDNKICIPDGDHWHEWSANYEKDEFDETMHHITKWDVALDVGAHVGIWSRNLVEKFKNIYAFEPVPKHIECWKQNMSQCDFTHFLNTVALGDENVINEMYVPIMNSGMASLVWPTPDTQTIEIETRTLDSYEFDQVDFIKIDVEGFEINVLRGAENTIRKHKPVMFIEISDLVVYDFIENLDIGYKRLRNSIIDQWNNSLFKIDNASY